MLNKRVTLVLATTFTLAVIVLAGIMPAQSIGPTGAWRLISPTEYTATPDAELHSVFLTNGGTSGKNSGSGWAVAAGGFIFFWDGFSWNQVPSPTTCQLDSVNFGGPLNPLSSVTSSSGWAVGGGATCAVAGTAESLYYNGVGWNHYSVPFHVAAELLSVSQVQSASSPGDSVNAFAVGIDNTNQGGFWEWSGIPSASSLWVELSTTALPVNSVYMTHCIGSPCFGDNGIAVGGTTGAGTIFRFVSGLWTPRADPVPTKNLHGVAMSSPTNGWAVGDDCTIIRTNDGDTWSGAASPGTCGIGNTLRSIVLLSSSEGWAVGDADASGAMVLHGTSLDSTPQWTRLPVNQVATPLGLDSVTFATSGGNLWSVGKSGVAAFCFNNCGSPSGAIWSTTTSPNQFTLNSVFMDSDSDGWAVGLHNTPSLSPTILRWDGGTFSWTRAPSVFPLASPTDLNSVYLSGGSSGWAVGSTTGPQASTLWYDGNTWTGRLVPACGCSLNSVYMVSDSDSWAVGSAATIMHSPSSGGSFSIASGPLPVPPAGTILRSVFFDPSSGGQSGWIAGFDTTNAVIYHTANGGADGWPPVGIPLLPGVTLTSLFFQDSTHGWAAGTKSTILYWNGVSWTQVAVLGAPNPIDINGIAVEGGTPATDGWAVGTDTVTKLPVTIHYDGTSWTVVPLSPAITLGGGVASMTSVSLRSSTNGLAVGSGVSGVFTDSLSLIFHLDPPGGVSGTTVATSSTPTTASTSSSSSSSTETTPTSTITSVVTSVQTSIQTSIATTTATPTSVTSFTSSSVSTPLTLPPIPGFPWESILAGVILGMTALAILRRRRK